jgi:hypothetical protein
LDRRLDFCNGAHNGGRLNAFARPCNPRGANESYSETKLEGRLIADATITTSSFPSRLGAVVCAHLFFAAPSRHGDRNEV